MLGERKSMLREKLRSALCQGKSALEERKKYVSGRKSALCKEESALEESKNTLVQERVR